MTVGQLILMLQKFNPETPVVVSDKSKNAPVGDFVDLDKKNIAKIKGKPLFSEQMYTDHQLYDGNITSLEDNLVEVVSLTGVPAIQRRFK